MKRTLLALFALITTFAATAQERYLDPVFTDVTVTSNVIYGVNATVLLLPVAGEAVPQPLIMDVYEPTGDSLTDRPLVLIFHSGNFLPFPQNGSVLGTRGDSAIVEVATRLAKMGYVTASVEYRLGWNPIASTQQERILTLINAAYRGVQDARTCVKFFRRSAAEQGNPFGIDPNKVVVWGHGTGGYIAMNMAVLDTYLKIPATPGGKFIIDLGGGNLVPMVIEGINGDLNDDSVGIVPPGYPGFPAGDTLSYPNHVGYSGDIQMAINLGGATGDSSWITPGLAPMVSFHCPQDSFAPYDIGLVLVPVLNLPVVEVAGSYRVQLMANRYNLNAAFAGKTYTGDFSAVANARNDGYDGLFPLPNQWNESAPWSWWSTSNPNHNPNAVFQPDPVSARHYIDTAIAYSAPRMCEVLGLGCQFIGREDLINVEHNLGVFPVPAKYGYDVQIPQGAILTRIEMYDLQGKMVYHREGKFENRLFVPRGNLATGAYILKAEMGGALLTRKVLFD